ncbi:hypothetical protein [Povalibacter sp.]|uniref:hypothetical protein n=1 Tax=Povalibacter sp. TaxID=1962978 RepID=UPI002F41DFC5
MWRVTSRSLGLTVIVAMGWSFTTGADDKIEVRPSSPVSQLAFDAARSARVQGRLVGKDKHEYTFDARKGQKVILAVSSDRSPWIGIDLLAPVFASSGKAAPAIYTNFIDGTTRWEGVAPGNGTYTVRLGLLRTQVQKVGRVDYELDVNLK